MKKFIISAIFIVISYVGAVAQVNSAQFTFVSPEKPEEIFGNSWIINIHGEITLGTTDRLEALVREKRIPVRSLIMLDSPGGSVVEAIKLGKFFRKMEFMTYVGKQTDWDVKMEPRNCFSACVLSHIGGKFRWVDDKSKVGVHQFSYSLKKFDSASNAQVLSDIIVHYIQSMGVSSELFSDMNKATSSDLFIVPKSRLIELNVVNNGIGAVAWGVVSIESGMYFKGERDTVWGVQKISFLCGERQNIGVVAIFDDQGRAEEIKNMNAVTFDVGGELLRVTDGAAAPGKIVRDGTAMLIFSVPRAMINKIASSNKLGVYLQYNFDAPVFLGIARMEFASARSKFLGFVRSCR